MYALRKKFKSFWCTGLCFLSLLYYVVPETNFAKLEKLAVTLRSGKPLVTGIPQQLTFGGI